MTMAPELPSIPPRRAARVRRLTLTNFRSWASATLVPGEGPVVLVGPNGAGKTNLIEAISFLAPGRGLRRATLEEVARDEGDGSWAVAAEIDGQVGEVVLGTGIAPSGPAGPATNRECRIDRAPVSSAATFAEHLSVAWLVPQMDGLFLGPAAERRRFLDRLVLAIDPAHSSRIHALERALRSRNKLLEQGEDGRWLDAVEHELAEVAVAVAAARFETVRRLAAQIAAGRDEADAFPWAGLALDGEMENAVATAPALALEDGYRARLAMMRARDRAAGRTLEGPHRSDLRVLYGPTGTPAERASTGEQKALLVGLILAHTRLVGAMTGLVPILLLDEIAAHFDPGRRAALYGALAALRTQAWLTGTDPAAFDALGPRSTRFAVEPGRIVTTD